VRSASTVRHIPAPAVPVAPRPLLRSVEAGATLSEVMRVVIDEANAMVGVVSSSGRLVGTISERDILLCLPPAGSPGAAALAYARFLQLRAVDVMADVDDREDAADGR